MTSKSKYGDWTYNSKNPLTRIAHRARFRLSVDHVQLAKNPRVLDFGCGDGKFLNQLDSIARKKEAAPFLVGFEPYMDPVSDNQIHTHRDWRTIEDIAAERKFDYVTSFEVFEHFNPQRQAEAIDRISTVLDDSGTLIMSVPIERGFTSVVKNVTRRLNFPQKKNLYSFRNIWKSLLGTPLPEFRSDSGYLSHMGFYFNDLEEILRKSYRIERRSFSPFQSLGHYVNSQVFYRCRKLI